MSVQIIASITLPDREGEGPTFSVEAPSNMDPDVILRLFLMMGEIHYRRALKEQMAESDPLLNEDLADTIAFLRTRMRMVDEVCHLPDLHPQGFSLDL